MVSNMRAYRDGNRLVVVIENPSQDLEALVAGMLTGEIQGVKNLEAPKKMTKPDLKLDQMQELKPVQETKSAMETAAEAIPNAASPKKAKFVQRMEDSAQADASNSAVTETVQQPEQENPVVEKLEPEDCRAAEPTHYDKTAETEDSVQSVVDSDKQEDTTVSEPKSEEQTSEAPRIENVIRFLRVHRNAPKLMALLRKDFHTTDVEVVIRRSTQEQLRALADALS